MSKEWLSSPGQFHQRGLRPVFYKCDLFRLAAQEVVPGRLPGPDAEFLRRGLYEFPGCFGRSWETIRGGTHSLYMDLKIV